MSEAGNVHFDDDLLTVAEARLRDFYELRAAEEPDRDPEALLRFRKAITAAGLRSGENVLDLGAKWGGLADAIVAAKLEVDYTGLDLSRANAEAAEAAGLKFIRGDVTKRLPFDGGSFDCVFCLELLEHLTIPLLLLGEIRRVLTEAGRAVISVPSPYSWVEVARELLDRPDPEGHLNSFTTPVMQNLAALAGLKIERRLGTSIRFPKTLRLISTNSILARSRIYVVRPSHELVFAGRNAIWSRADVVHAKLVALLRAEGAEFRLTHHEPVTTSAQAAAVRGAELRSGAKAMLVKAKTGFALVVLTADRKVDWKLLAPFVGKGARFATEDELRGATGLSKGAVPPLGVLFGLRTIYDRSLLEVETVNFNAGTHTDSITMSRGDLIRIGGGEVAAFSTA